MASTMRTALPNSFVSAVSSVMGCTFEDARRAPASVFICQRPQQRECLEDVVRRSGDDGAIPVFGDEALVKLAHRDAMCPEQAHLADARHAVGEKRGRAQEELEAQRRPLVGRQSAHRLV